VYIIKKNIVRKTIPLILVTIRNRKTKSMREFTNLGILTIFLTCTFYIYLTFLKANSNVDYGSREINI
jgi:hypothetical protein